MTDTLQLIWTMSWQVGILAAAVWLVTRAARRAPASWRHALWALVLVKFIVPPFAYLPESLVVWEKPEPVAVSSLPAPQPQRVVVNEPAATEAQPTFAPTEAVPPTAPAPERSRVPSVPTLLAAAWLLGACIAASTLLLRLLMQRRITRRALPVSVAADEVLADCASAIRVKRLPLLMQSPHASTPMLVGVLKPIILLPMGLTETSPEPELRAILLHELAHVRRRDMLVLWLQHLVAIAFYFNPALWLVARELKRERELACDELVLSTQTITRQAYAAGYLSALKMAAGAVGTPVSLAMAEPFDIEKRRLQMILSRKTTKLTPALVLTALAVAVLGLPTFAGLASREPQATAVPAPKAEMTVTELFTRMAEGRARMAAEVRSGKGEMRCYRMNSEGPERSVKGSSAIVRLAFAGDRYAIVFKEARGNISGSDVVYDGKQRWWLQHGASPIPMKPDDALVPNRYSAFARMSTLAYPDIVGILRREKHDPDKARIKGYLRAQDRTECLVIESSREYSGQDGVKQRDVRLFYLDPSRDYVLREVRKWTYREHSASMKLHRTIQTEIYYKQHGTMWLPRSYGDFTHIWDAETGKRYLDYSATYHLKEDFVINGTITETDLQLPLTKPALKPAPVADPKLPIGGRMTGRYGYRAHPVTGVEKLHTGIDISAKTGTPVKATADGKVVRAGWGGAYGKRVVLQHEDGVVTVYGQCSELAVTAGQDVRKGDVIAYVGATGYATGPHLHYEKRVNGVPVDPLKP